MQLGFQAQNNGNGRKPLVTSDNLKNACSQLGLPDDKHTLRRAARAFDLYYSDKVEHVNDHTFSVASQYDRNEKPYQVLIKPTKYLPAGGYAYCTCQDWMNYSGDQDLPDVNFWCKHSIAALIWLHKNGNGNGTRRITNNCGSNEALELQNELNHQVTCQRILENRAKKNVLSNIDPSAKPFLEADTLDANQILTGEGSKVHKLSDGSYCISFLGIMHLANKHGIITETLEDTPEGYVTVKAFRPSTKNSRKSVQPVNGSLEVAEGKAKRNAVRMLIPLIDIKTIEHKAKLEFEFSWEKAKRACLKFLLEHCINLIIRDLVQEGYLRQASPSEYNRLEWRLIYETCKREDAQPDPKSIGNWSYNSPIFIDKCRDAIANVKTEKLRKPVEQIFCRTNGTTKKLKKLYDEKPIEFLIDTTKPNVVKLIFSNGTVAKVYDQVIYESVLRA